jgi:hypothetical protein
MSLPPLRTGLQSSRTPGTLLLSLSLSHVPIRLSSSRPGTYELIQAKNLSSALIPLAKNASPAQMNSLVTLVYTTMITLISSIHHQFLPKGLQKSRSIFQCQTTLLSPAFPIQETPSHLQTITRRLGRKRRQKVVLTVMTRYLNILMFISFSFIYIVIVRMNLTLVQHQ